MARRSTLNRVRRSRFRRRESGFIVTWDVNSADRPVAHRVRYFVFGTTVSCGGRVYHYSGFVEKDGVRYLGQSVIFVRPSLLREIDAFLVRNGVDHEATPAILG